MCSTRSARNLLPRWIPDRDHHTREMRHERCRRDDRCRHRCRRRRPIPRPGTLRAGASRFEASALGHRCGRVPRPGVRLLAQVPARRAFARRRARFPDRTRRRASGARCRAARMPTFSASSSATSARRCSSCRVSTGSATRWRSRRWCASATRRSSTRSCSAALEAMFGRGMPDGYVRTADPNEVARAVLSKSTWAVLALTCHIELVRAEPLRAEHRRRTSAVGAVQGRVHVPLAGGVPARDPGRDRVAARARAPDAAQREQACRRPDRAGRRGRRHPAGTGGSGRGVLHAPMRRQIVHADRAGARSIRRC